MAVLGQFDAALYGKISSVRSDFDTHESANTGIHGATANTIANRLVLRDADGRARVASPTSSSDDGTIATTEWARDTLATEDSESITSISQGVGLSLSPNPIVTTGTINLADTSVTAGDYTFANITVDAQGRITAANNGVFPVIEGLNPGEYKSATVGLDHTGLVTFISSHSRVLLYEGDEDDEEDTFVSGMTLTGLDLYDYITVALHFKKLPSWTRYIYGSFTVPYSYILGSRRHVFLSSGDRAYHMRVEIPSDTPTSLHISDMQTDYPYYYSQNDTFLVYKVSGVWGGPF